ncbi:outer membrane protein assembly factor BamB family protein [Thalassoglobus polymorphus]|uniref:outer membrane protein assembly factor BamB family protein n=1 Tax=Thalassoglobus polymorphus TaxID=2527994 RepID=UPI0018D21D9F|nr:PQQ-binding-like beta-propeller repeat protein [Thalassoglobus polymorphus]
MGILLSSAFNTPVSAQIISWPQFRGPGGQGIFENVSLPIEWSEKENIRWKCEIPGLGHSSPVHDGETCWLTTATPDGKILGVVSVNLSNGKLDKNLTIFEPQNLEKIHYDNSYASPTPVLKDKRLYVHYGTYGTACIDCESGRIVWKNNDFPVEHQGGPGSSPVIFEDMLILTLDGAQQQRVVALDLKDGSLRWERKRSAPLRPNPITHRAFSTPLLYEYKGSTQLLSPGADQIHAYDPATGNEIWHARYVGFSTVPCPTAQGNIAVFCTGYFQPELWAVTLDGSGDITESHRKWKFRGPIPDIPSPIIVDDQVVIISNKGVATGLDLQSGKRKWVLRVGGNFSASPIYANGLIYLCSEEGVTKIIDPQTKKPRIKQANRLEDGIKATPAIINNDLLIRTTKALYRINTD